METLLNVLVGTWFICSTNFPMWTKGNKTNPTFNYTVIVKSDGSKIMGDNVSYLKNGRSKSIKGFDHPDKKDSTAFVWRGKGLLGLLKSKWRVALIDPAHNWAVIYFTRTAFTPEGVDIISRQATLPIETLEQVKLQMLKDPVLKKHVSSLKHLY